MTDEEKGRLRELKRLTAGRLRGIEAESIGRYRFALEDTDPRLREYVDGVCLCPDRHNLYELLSVVRFFRLLDTYQWRAKRVRRFFMFYESLRFSGTGGRRRYTLTPIQCFQFASMFGFVDSLGRRLVRDAYLFIPRKFSKTTSAASLAVYDMFCGDANAQAYVGANSYQQAKICFDEIRGILKSLDPSGRHFKVNREMVMFSDGSRESFARCLSGNPKTLDGLNASTVIMDEYAQARDTKTVSGAELKNVLTSSMGVRKQPLTVVITTASMVIDGPFAHELAAVKKLLETEVEPNADIMPNDRIFASLFMPDVDDREDDPATWAKVHPHLGVTVQSDFYEIEWAKAQLSAENMLEFRTKYLNIFAVNEDNVWFTPEKARSLLQPFDIMQIGARMPTAVAFDLSVHDDFSAVSYTCWHSQQRRFFCHTDYYFPEGALARHPNRRIYEAWHEQGYLRYCRGDVIDVKQIADDIIGRSRSLKIVQIGYDSYKAQDLVNILLTFRGGQRMLTPYKQTYGNFNLPVESFEMMAWSDPPRIVLDDNPINAYCLSNCVIDEDNLENKKPMKAAQYQKIDGTITCLMTIGLLNTYQHG